MNTLEKRETVAVTKKADITSSVPNTYPPSHCWYYHLGGRILTSGEIDAADCDFKAPKAHGKHLELITKTELGLALDVDRYNVVCNELVRGDIDSCVNVSLKHNHISYNKAKLAKLKAQLPNEQLNLF